MKLYEYQAIKILHKYNINVPNGGAVSDAEEVAKIYSQLGTEKCVIKAQVLAGGRGKGGGVKIVKTLDEAKAFTTELIGSHLITAQTGEQGALVNKVLVAEAIDIKKELYLAISIDRSTSGITIMSSTEGGTEIEEVSAKTPHKILKEQINPLLGVLNYQARQIAQGLDLTGPLAKKVPGLIKNLFKIFVENDCSLLEINPLVLTPDDEIVVLDIKMDIDDNALFRHRDILFANDLTEDSSAEKMASEAGLSYIGLDGNIGCLVNGAGLAMATMDIIKLYGGAPANFLDVGGDASVEKVTTAFEIIFTDPHVAGVLVNIFGGIMKCDIIAEGIIHAMEKVDIKVPLVVRLEGTNVEIARKKLDDSKLNLIFADSMKDASEKIINAVNEKK